MTPDELAADLDKGANALEFMHRVTKGTATMEDWIAALNAAELSGKGTLDFLMSDTCEQVVQKMKDLEQRRVLLRFISRWLSAK